MRLLTFSFIRNCKFKLLVNPKKYSNVAGVETAQKPLADPSSSINLLQIAPTWKEDEDTELRSAVIRDMQVLPNFVTEAEEQCMLNEIEPYLKRMRYEYDHWDNAIEGYRETERREWSEANTAVLARVKNAAFVMLAGRPPGEPLPYTHVLDLAGAGHIKPHVDAVRFCGEVIAGICLMSSAVMRLVHCKRPHIALDALLPRRGLYIMRGVARYDFTHAVLGGDDSIFRGEKIIKSRRIAVICRSKPAPASTLPDQPRLYP